MSARKFLQICESVLTRTQRNGFLVNDVVEIVNYNKIDANVRDAIKQMVDQGYTLRVVDITNKYPSDKPGTDQNVSNEFNLVLAIDQGGGRFIEKFIVSPECCKVIDTYPNLPALPDALKRDNINNIKPEPVSDYNDQEFSKQSNHSDDGKGNLQRTSRKLGDKNVKQPGPNPPKYAPNFK